MSNLPLVAVGLFGLLAFAPTIPLIGRDLLTKPSTRQVVPQPEVIRDRLGRILGTIRPTYNGRLEARSRLGALLGTYDPKANVTRDRIGRMLTTGNTLSALVVGSAQAGR